MRVYNSLSHEEEEFVPLDPDKKKVGIYACGPTVYDVPHLGHARSEVVFDLIHRYLIFKGYEVNYVHNFTDIDDKMIDRANQRGIDISTLAEENILQYKIMQKYLGVKNPTHTPRATEEIPEMIKFIQTLEEKEYAYVADGSVYFDTSKVENYDLTFRRTKHTDGTEGNDYSGSDYLHEKRNKQDFVLWKKKKEGEPSWNSPWGEGRPGWHIECSVMSMKYIGETLDIHGGGMDLRNPHHQNEIAQSEAATGKPFANYWIHNGFLNIDNVKMSKSLGNFVTVNDIRERYPGKLVRFFLLSYHYRSPVSFSDSALEESKKAYDRIASFYNDISKYEDSNELDEEEIQTLEQEDLEFLNQIHEDLINSMDIDFNTADTIGHLFKLINRFQSKINKKEPISKNTQSKIVKFLKEIDEFLGFIISEEEKDTEWKKKFSTLVDALLEYRMKMRKEKKWEISDSLRDIIEEFGIQINDEKNSSSWQFNNI